MARDDGEEARLTLHGHVEPLQLLEGIEVFLGFGFARRQLGGEERSNSRPQNDVGLRVAIPRLTTLRTRALRIGPEIPVGETHATKTEGWIQNREMTVSITSKKGQYEE